MIYATADLHGYPMEKFFELLRSVRFGGEDYLFVLGDVIDRNGDGGVGLLRWMMEQPNVELILGNHEAMLLACDFLFEEITEESISGLNPWRMGAYMDWARNGAGPTLEALRALKARDPEALRDLLGYLRGAPLYDTVTAGQGDFLLVHAGLGNFAPERKLSTYLPEELLWCRPTREDAYFDHVTTILGHTPTAVYGSPGRMFVTPTWIDIDTGAGGGGDPMLLRLDDLTAHYAR